MVNEPGAPARFPRNRNTRVLIVEDEFLVAIDLEGQLRELGLEVMGLVASMREARDRIALDRPDLVLLDVALADGRSTALAEELRAASIPFCVISGYGESHLDEEVLRNVPHLDKPGDIESLRSVIRQLLGA